MRTKNQTIRHSKFCVVFCETSLIQCLQYFRISHDDLVNIAEKKNLSIDDAVVVAQIKWESMWYNLFPGGTAFNLEFIILSDSVVNLQRYIIEKYKSIMNQVKDRKSLLKMMSVLGSFNSLFKFYSYPGKLLVLNIDKNKTEQIYFNRGCSNFNASIFLKKMCIAAIDNRARYVTIACNSKNSTCDHHDCPGEMNVPLLISYSSKNNEQFNLSCKKYNDELPSFSFTILDFTMFYRDVWFGKDGFSPPGKKPYF